jgi:hypothetical protein
MTKSEAVGLLARTLEALLFFRIALLLAQRR